VPGGIKIIFKEKVKEILLKINPVYGTVHNIKNKMDILLEISSKNEIRLQNLENKRGHDLTNYDHIQSESTIIEIPEIERIITLMLITDMHLTYSDERDSGEVREMALERAKALKRFSDRDTEDLFDDILRYAVNQNVDCLVLVGDIIDFLTPKNVEKLNIFLNKYRVPYFYIVGNHEHIMKHLWSMDLLLPFTNNRIGCNKMEIGGVKFIGIDNTGYKVSAEQLAFLSEETADNKPCLLFMHIPLYIESLEKSTLEVWHSPIMLGIPESLFMERRPGIIHVPLPDNTTMEFCRLIERSTNIYGVFAGHLHFSHTDVFTAGKNQYVTLAGYEGGCRKIIIKKK